ncbi:DEAD/DEAH box helicase-like protein [Peziza echinospora]|nr:DEAD/DEAH box helicase-like protein [Peziza echinospora]
MSTVETTAGSLKEWYSSLKRVRLDVIGDFAGSELFMIDGNSLLRHVLGDELIDMNDGFQLLHAVYTVERFLSDLEKRTCSFHVVFFESHQTLSVPETIPLSRVNKYLLTRACLIQHLDRFSEASSNKSVFHFSSPQDAAFTEYLSEFRPYFVLAHDGARVKRAGAIADAEDGLKRHLDAEEQVFLGFIWDIMGRGYTVGLVNEVEFEDSKVFTLIAPPQKLATFRSRLTGLGGLLISAKDQTIPIPDLPEGVTLQSFDEATSSEFGSPAELLNFTALKEILSKYQELAAPFALHVAFLKHLTLAQRNLPPLKFDDQEQQKRVASFFDDLSAVQLQLLNDPTFVEVLRKKTETDATGVEDLVDGRLFSHVLAAWSATPPTTPTEVQADYERLLATLKSVSNADIQGLEGLSYKATLGSVAETQDATLKVLPFSNPVFTSHFAGLKLAVDSGAGKEIERTSFERALYEANWNTKKLSAIDEERKKGAVTHIQEKKQWWQLKGDQIYQANMLRYAQSLAGGDIQPERIIPRKDKDVKKVATKPVPAAKALKLEKEAAKAEKEAAKKEAPGKKGAAGKSDKAGKPEKAEAPKKGAPAGKKGKPEVLSKSDQIIAANAQARSAKTFKKALDTWKLFYSSDVAPSKTDRSKVSVLTEFIRKSSEEIVTVEARLLKCEFLFNIWKSDYCDPSMKSERAKGYEIAVLLFDEARKVISSPSLSKQIKAHLDALFVALGFTPLTLPPRDEPLATNTMTISPPPRIASSTIDTKIGTTLQEFQLRHCGPYMDRNLDSREDARVKFTPDAWQVQVLDALDEDKSIFVVAPTSAGKTFIAYYAMEKVLRANDDDVIVYIAPTKALVNQIAAEIQSRFVKDYKNPGRTVWAIHTGEYQIQNPQKCQILVTVPEILQRMLLSPPLAATWAPKVKRIILDEVHCIGQSEEGAVWEQLLLLSPCPIIALSATVGNPNEFHDWLQLTQNKLIWKKPNETKASKGVEVVMIRHGHRFNHLRTFYYEGEDSKKKKFKGLEPPPANSLGLPNLEDSKFHFVHPATSLCDTVKEIPDDLALEPRDCFLLYQAMIKAQTASYPFPADAQPSAKWFPEIIKKADVLKWEARLKEILQGWLLDHSSPFTEVLNILRDGKLAQVAKFIEENKIPELEETEEELQEELPEVLKDAPPAAPGAEFVPTPSQALTPAMLKTVAVEEVSVEHLATLSKTLGMLNELNKLNALPALLFNYDRTMCEVLFITLTEQLVKGEESYRTNSKEWNRKVAEREIWMKKKEEMDRRAGRLKKVSKKGNDDPEDAKAAREMDARDNESPYASFDPEEPSDAFTFAGKRYCPKDELERDLAVLRRAAIDPIYIEGLRRGVGIHHTGLSRPLRECVERLFRRGFLRVVIATGTLALGINMPCATVVFVTDSVELTPLSYRQASGRAGRRGFDLLGNVIFHGVPLQRSYRLMNSHLPSLMGHFPTSVTLILRLFVLLHGSDNSAHAVSLVNALLSQNKLSLGDVDAKDQVLHQVRFSIEYLRRMNLLSATGEPINFAAMAAHLNFAEPSNFVFNDLLRTGVFHEICSELSSGTNSADPVTVTKDVNRKLMLIMSHLFGRRPFRKSENVERLTKQTGSIVLLHDLPKEVEAIIQKHNEEALKIYTRYAITFAKQTNQNSLDDELPYTRRKAGARTEGAQTPFQSSPPVLARSSFVALSGHTDEFKNLPELFSTCRHSMLLEASGVPYLPVGSEVRLNAYLYDFFMHGDREELIKVNKIGREVVWFYLNDFSKVLATIVSSLRNLIELGPDREMKTIDINNADRGMGDVLEEELEKEASEEVSAVATEIKPAATASSATNRPELRLNRDPDEPVTNRWEEEESGSEDEEAPWDEEEANANRQALLKVLKGFVNLQTEFNTKFRSIFATKADAVRAAKKNKTATKIKKPMLVKR